MSESEIGEAHVPKCIQGSRGNRKEGNLKSTIFFLTSGFVCLCLAACEEKSGKAIEIEKPEDPIEKNEAYALNSIRSIGKGQIDFRKTVTVDLNGNGCGEPGFLNELGGTISCRNLDQSTYDIYDEYPFINRALGEVSDKGISQVCYYCFTVYLPKGEKTGSPVSCDEIDASLSELVWVAYAWPLEKEKTGNRAFAAIQRGKCTSGSEQHEPLEAIYSTSIHSFSGPSNPPPWNAIFGTGETWKSAVDEAKWKRVDNITIPRSKQDDKNDCKASLLAAVEDSDRSYAAKDVQKALAYFDQQRFADADAIIANVGLQSFNKWLRAYREMSK